MRRTTQRITFALVLVIACVAIVSPVGPPQALAQAQVDPTVRAELTAASANDTVDVVVVLRQQEDLSRIKGNTVPKLRAAIVRALRARSMVEQQAVRSFLNGRRAQGLVQKVVPLWIFNALEVVATPSVINELAARSDVREIRPNLTVQASSLASPSTAGSAEPTLASTRAQELWDRGFTGQGVVVANMDTGVDVTHPDLANRWRGGTNSWFDPNGQHPVTPVDVDGHGTWTMGVMVGGDASGTSIGMAPGAKWIAVKIFNDRGVATATGIHQGFQWLLDPDNNPATDDAPDVVNNSWTMTASGCNLDFQPDLRALRASGILPIFAAGNTGPSAGTILSPANNPEAYAVGSIDSADLVDISSSRGPSPCGQPLDPHLVAPGVNVRTADLYGLYTVRSGTSLAAPHAAGAVALLLSAVPGVNAAQQEADLDSGALDLGPIGPDDSYGSGRLDALGAYDWLLGAPDFGLSTLPSTASTQAGGTVTYSVAVASRNGFTGDVSFSLSGLSGSQASWSFNPAVVTGGSGTAQLSITTASTLPSGSYPVALTAQSGSITRTTSVNVEVLPPPDFGLSASPPSRTAGQGSSVAYTVSVSPLNGFTGGVNLALTGLPPSVGSATFSPAAVSSAGTSQLTITTPASAPTGTYPLTVTGSSGSLTHTAAITLVVTPPPNFSLTASPASQTVAAGTSVTYPVTVNAINGFTGSVNLALSGLPASVGSSTFTPSVLIGTGSSQLTISTTASAPPGTYPLTITGTSGSLTHSASVTLVVAVPDFSLSTSPTSISIPRGQAASYTITVASIAGFSGSVSLSVKGLPSKATATLTPSSVAAPGTSTLLVKTKAVTPRGTFTLRVTGTSGTRSHQVTVALVVT